MDGYSVSEVNRFIKQIFSYEQIFYNINVKGEISNFKYHSSGNMFFTLNDEKSQIKCVMFKMYADSVAFFPKNGMFVCVRGDLNVYERNGTYQIYVTAISERGEGLIQKKFDMLSEKLMNEGFFDRDKKHSFSKLPRVVGVVTAPDGAALQDVYQILSRRLPILRLKVFSCLVQGLKAVNSIVRAIKLASYDDEVDSLIICRGGGSHEDLNPFDDEMVCRAVFECNKPVISAIGHETDHCLLDFVADLRAPTPSAAAELVCVDCKELNEKIDSRFDDMQNSLLNFLNEKEFKLNNLQAKLACFSPYGLLMNLEFRTNEFANRLFYLVSRIFLVFYDEVEKISSLLKNLSPFGLLQKGYCLVFDESGSLVRQVDNVKIEQNLSLMFSDGSLKAKVVEKDLKK